MAEASSPLLDFDALVAPISAASPVGVESTPRGSTLGTFRQQYKELITPGEKRDKPDWNGVVRLACDTLQKELKSLEVAGRLTLALTVKEGFAGLRDGLHLIADLAEKCWDRIHPALDEDGKADDRSERLGQVLNSVTGNPPLLPVVVRQIPILKTEGHSYGVLHVFGTEDERGAVDQADLEKAERSVAYEACAVLRQEIEEAWAQLERLGSAWQTQAKEPVGLTNLRDALDTCKNYVAALIKKKQPEAAAGPGPSTEPGSPMPTAMGTRQQAIEQLKAAAAVLEKLEPQSPIPLLVKQAVELSKLSFDELMALWMRDPDVLKLWSRGYTSGEAPPPQS